MIISFAVSPCAFAQSHNSGQVEYVTDGDTFILNSEKIRIHGIDAPGRNDNNQPAEVKIYHDAAKAALAAIVQRGVQCGPSKGTSWKRVVRTCYALDTGHDVAAVMVISGYAVDDARYSKGIYQNYENVARTSRRGVWQTVTKSWR